VKALAAHRRHPLSTAVLLLLALALTGALFAVLSPTRVEAAGTLADEEELVTQGQKLFLANCATCHGINAAGTRNGPTLIGVGAASVDFQVGTGRMPMQNTGPQAPRKPPQFTEEQVAAMAAYVASLAPGPGIPAEEYTSPEGGDPALGGEIFRVNCAMCHNAVGAGGALTRGKYAPAVVGIEGKYIYEAMVTGPQAMPVFNDLSITPEEKRDIIAYLDAIEQQGSPSPLALGSLGPVSEGLFVWIGLMALMIAASVWLTMKSS
jgi:ubiquinol-cytochrome c reductase cytochrome c subunit